jgi:hypothetical protein
VQLSPDWNSCPPSARRAHRKRVCLLRWPRGKSTLSLFRPAKVTRIAVSYAARHRLQVKSLNERAVPCPVGGTNPWDRSGSWNPSNPRHSWWTSFSRAPTCFGSNRGNRRIDSLITDQGAPESRWRSTDTPQNGSLQTGTDYD